jgi:hypothetical protein
MTPRSLPDDPDIPALTAMRSKGFRSVLAEAGVAGPLAELALTSHHRRIRCTFVATSQEGRIVIKAYGETDDPAPVVEFLSRIGRSPAGSSPVAVPEVLAYDSSLHLLVMRWLDGPSGEELIVRGSGARAGELAASWLRTAASMRVELGPVFGRESVLDDVRRSVRAIDEHDAGLGREARLLAGTISADPPLESGPIVSNGSFRAEHVLDLGDRPAVIDWDAFRRAPAELDAAMFLAGLSFLAKESPETKDQAEAARSEFRDGLTGVVDDRPLAWYRAAALLRLAKFRPAERRWRARATALITEARGLLG